MPSRGRAWTHRPGCLAHSSSPLHRHLLRRLPHAPHLNHSCTAPPAARAISAHLLFHNTTHLIMVKKRRNNGRAKKNRGVAPLVHCDSCGALTPKVGPPDGSLPAAGQRSRPGAGPMRSALSSPLPPTPPFRPQHPPTLRSAPAPPKSRLTLWQGTRGRVCVRRRALRPARHPLQDKAVKRFRVRRLIDAASEKDIREACVFTDSELPRLYLKMYYCVSCACHARIVRVRSKADRKIRATSDPVFGRPRRPGQRPGAGAAGAIDYRRTGTRPGSGPGGRRDAARAAARGRGDAAGADAGARPAAAATGVAAEPAAA